MCQARAWLLGVGAEAWLGAAEARRGAVSSRGAAELLQLASIDHDVPVGMGLLRREGSLRAHTKSHEPQQWFLLSREHLQQGSILHGFHNLFNNPCQTA